MARILPSALTFDGRHLPFRGRGMQVVRVGRWDVYVEALSPRYRPLLFLPDFRPTGNGLAYSPGSACPRCNNRCCQWQPRPVVSAP
jgi:hypothetical protein